MVIKGSAVYDTDNSQIAISELFLNLKKIKGTSNIEINIVDEVGAENEEYPADMLYFMEFSFINNRDKKEVIKDLKYNLFGFGLEENISFS